MPKPRDRRKKPWREDGYVLVHPKWLRALLTELGVTVAELARRTKQHEQTLAHLAKGDEPKRTRASRRRAIAKALGVAEHHLEGGARLPHGERLGYETAYSARTWLATTRLLSACRDATLRDLEAAGVDDETSEGMIVLGYVEDMVLDLLHIGSWRERLILWDPPRHARQGYTEPLSDDITDLFGGRPVNDPEHEEGTLALIRAFEHILAPWFAGTARLDYATVREFATAPVPAHTAERMIPLAIVRPHERDALARPSRRREGPDLIPRNP